MSGENNSSVERFNLVARALVCGTFDPAPTQRTVILSHRRRISRPPFLRLAIWLVLVSLGITWCSPANEINRSARNAPSEILRCAQDDGSLSPQIILALRLGTLRISHDKSLWRLS